MTTRKFISVLLSVLITLSCLVTATIVPVTAVEIANITEQTPTVSTTSTTVSSSVSTSQNGEVPLTTTPASNQSRVAVVTAISTPDRYITGTTAATTTTRQVMSATEITTTTTTSAVSGTYTVSSSWPLGLTLPASSSTSRINIVPTTSFTTTSAVSDTHTVSSSWPLGLTLPVSSSTSRIYIVLTTSFTTAATTTSFPYTKYQVQMKLGDVSGYAGETVTRPFEINDFYGRDYYTIDLSSSSLIKPIAAYGDSGAEFECDSENNNMFCFTEKTGYIVYRIDENAASSIWLNCTGTNWYEDDPTSWYSFAFFRDEFVIYPNPTSTTTITTTTTTTTTTKTTNITSSSAITTVTILGSKGPITIPSDTVTTPQISLSVTENVTQSLSVASSMETSLITTIIWGSRENSYDCSIELRDVNIYGKTIQIPFELSEFPDTNSNKYEDFFVEMNVYLPQEAITVSAFNSDGTEFELLSSDSDTYAFKVTEQKGYLDITIDENLPAGEYEISLDGYGKAFYLTSGGSYGNNPVCLWVTERFYYKTAAAVINVKDETATTPVVTEPVQTTSATVSTTETTVTEPEASEIISGDADGDNEVNVRDCAFIASSLAKGLLSELTLAADFNGDGTVNVRDAAAIAYYLAKNK